MSLFKQNEQPVLKSSLPSTISSFKINYFANSGTSFVWACRLYKAPVDISVVWPGSGRGVQEKNKLNQ